MWLNFDSSIGYLSGIPLLGHEGSYNDIEITVSDGSTVTMLEPFSITVELGVEKIDADIYQFLIIPQATDFVHRAGLV